MFKKVLLPLDGSELAETAIPYAENTVGRLDSELVLLHVHTPEHEPYRHMHEIYLEHIANGVRQNIKANWNKEASISTQAISGKPAELIPQYIQDNNIDMVIMTSCGASGIKALLGSVVDRVVRTVNVPTLLIRVKDGRSVVAKPGVINRILLPLDGSEPSKISLHYAVELAKKLNASITLFEMAETVYAHGLDGLAAGVGVNWDQIDVATEKYVHAYLENIEQELKQQGIAVTHVVTLGVDPANEILEQEKKTGADLIVMATRGRSKVARWAFGSVAEKVLREGGLPLLVVKQG